MVLRYGALVPPSLVDDEPMRASYLAKLAGRDGYRLTRPVNGVVVEDVTTADLIGRIWADVEATEASPRADRCGGDVKGGPGCSCDPEF